MTNTTPATARASTQVGCNECAWGKVAGCWKCGSCRTPAAPTLPALPPEMVASFDRALALQIERQGQTGVIP